jgi:hypothetical protein
VPSLDHEVLVELFRQRKSLAPDLLAHVFGIELPEYSEIRTEEATLNELVPTEYRADLVLLLENAAPVFGIVVEAQLQSDSRKQFSWPVYAATIRARFECPCVVMVVTPDESVAEWASASIALGGRSVFKPEVLGPSAIPRITSTDDARSAPELAVLSTLAHGREDDALEVAKAALEAIADLDDDHVRLYYDLILDALSEAARKELRSMVLSRKYEYRSDFARKYYGEGLEKGREQGREEGLEKGREEGRATMLLKLMELRGFQPSTEVVAQVRACSDSEQLERWFERAMTAVSFDDIFR